MAFYLVSTELSKPFRPRYCELVRRLRSDETNELALVSIDPALPRRVYNLSSELTELILAPRLEGSGLFPVLEWPSYVYVCWMTSSANSVPEFISDSDLRILDWGAIYQSKVDAEKAIS